MNPLKCEALDCMYNSETDCTANVIHVNSTRRDTFCDTYTRRDAFVADQAGKLPHLSDMAADAEFGSELVDTPKISCTATRCAYNKAFHCMASGVLISRPHDLKCRCVTYMPK